MKVKELKEKLNQFDDNLNVIGCNSLGGFFPVTNICQGFKELDGCIILDDYEEDEG